MVHQGPREHTPNRARRTKFGPAPLFVCSIVLFSCLALPPLSTASPPRPLRPSVPTTTSSLHDVDQEPNRPRALSGPQPTQFEVAMGQTIQAVKEGRAPDPALRKPDGTPGTLLEALLRDSVPEKDRARRRRQLEESSSLQFFGVNTPFLTGPTLSALNVSFTRYSSVTPLTSVDWRNTIYLTPIQMQFDCASCWAMAAADTVAIATAIASGRPPIPAGVQQICDCSGMQCCQGGWPEDAFAWMLTQGNITSAASYNYWAQDGRKCTVQPNYPTAGNLSGWERVPIYSQLELMKAVNMQPVLVYISASSKDFMTYSSTAPGTDGFNIYDGNCSTEVNHAMVVVGYDTTGTVDYWILKNTWDAVGWGHNGYMYIKMQDGAGKCGMLMSSPIFPTYYPNAPQQATVQSGTNYPMLATDSYWWSWWQPRDHPCIGVINPCGAGVCYEASSGIARCMCPQGYVEMVGVPTSKCVDPSPCSNGQFNPCGAGTCTNVGDGSYFCSCPPGYIIGVLVNGFPSCVPALPTNATTYTYITQYHDTCTRIKAAFNISSTVFSLLNPYLVCSRLLLPGIAVQIPYATAVLCPQQYAVQPGDTCETLPLPASAMKALNPRLRCTHLFTSQLVCVNGTIPLGAGSPVAAPPLCGQTYLSLQGDTCASVQAQFALNITLFQRLNPGVNCDYNSGLLLPGLQICIKPQPPPIEVLCTQWYTVQQGDTCAHIWNAANLSQYQMMYINPGLQCQPPFLHIGRQICIDSPLLVNIADPGYLLYTVQPGETWSSVQAQFTSKCQAFSISIPRIATQNNITDWVNHTLQAGDVLVIPCVQRIRATCGCATSLTVCGANLVNYDSYCDARCNFATPLQSSEACSMCQNACMGRYGLTASPLSACPAGYVCPLPQWPPPDSDASAIFTTSPLCSYRIQTCTRACAIYNTMVGVTDSTCYNSCTACQRVPCTGPPEAVAIGDTYCPSCAADGCDPYSKTSCNTDCNYWNSWWTKLNP